MLYKYQYNDIILISSQKETTMPVIRKSADLRNKYGEISDFCHKHKEPVFITRNGEGDLAVMSMETYHEISGRQELYDLIDEGLADVKAGRTHSIKTVFKDWRKILKRGKT